VRRQLEARLAAVVVDDVVVVEARNGVERIHRDEHVADVRVDDVLHEALVQVLQNAFFVDARDQRHVVQAFLTQLVVPLGLTAVLCCG
jgi:hypothetical protein